MNKSTCDYEGSVKRALLSGHWDEDVRAHTASCLICREVVTVSGYMQSLAERSAPAANPPAAGYIWWKAGLLRRQAAEKKIMRSIMVTRFSAYGVFAFGLGGWIFYRWPEAQKEIDRFFRWDFLQDGSSFASGVRSLVGLTVVLLALNIALTLRAIWVAGRLKKRLSARRH